MNRNTVIGIIALVGIAAGTLVWRYWAYQHTVQRQKELTQILDSTVDNLPERITRVQDFMAAHPDDKVIRRVGLYQILRARNQIGSDGVEIIRAAKDFLAVDSSGAALSYVASLYADRKIDVATGLGYANRALADVEQMDKPSGISNRQWAGQHRMMVGACQHIRGRLLALNNEPRSAVMALSVACDSVPGTPDVLLDLGKAYEQAGERDSAFAKYLDVLRLRYDDQDARSGAARLYSSMSMNGEPFDAMVDTLVQHARAGRKAMIYAACIDSAPRELPAVDLVSPDGSPVHLDEMRDSVVVLYLWATWCEPCKQQLPLFEAAYRRFGKSGPVKFYAVSLDERPEVVKPFMDRHGYTFPVAIARNYRPFDVEGLPTLIVLDGKGRVRYHDLGHGDAGDFVEEIGWRIEAASDTTLHRSFTVAPTR